MTTLRVQDLLPGHHATLDAEDARRAAHTYLDLGWAVIPGPGLDAAGHCSCHKGAECRNAGKHAHSGWGNAQRRTLRRDEVDPFWSPENEAWRHKPVDNVFLVPYLSGLIVADVDDLAAWAQVDDAPDTLRQRSGSGRGEHWLYRFSWDTAGNPPHVRGMLPHTAGEVRFRAVIVAAPSMHVSGGRYEWLNWGHEIAPAPDWLTKPLTQPEAWSAPISYGWWTSAMVDADLQSARDLATMPSDKPGGGRVGALFAVACRLGRWVAGGVLDAATAAETLRESARANGSMDKYGADEIERHIMNGFTSSRTELHK